MDQLYRVTKEQLVWLQDELKELKTIRKSEIEEMLAEAMKRAESEVQEMGRTADAEAMASARSLADNGETKKAVMRARAEKHMPDAVALIVERIVKG